MRYRLSKYSSMAWQVERWIVPEKGKYKGVGKWHPYKYPGNLEQSARFLVDASLGDFSAEDAQSIVDAVENGTARVLDALEARFDSESEVVVEV